MVEEARREAILKVGDKLPHRRHGARSGHGQSGVLNEEILIFRLAPRVELLLVLRGKKDVHEVTERTLVGGTHLGQLGDVQVGNVLSVSIDELIVIGRGSLGRELVHTAQRCLGFVYLLGNVVHIHELRHIALGGKVQLAA